jgi:hypothetical protein
VSKDNDVEDIFLEEASNKGCINHRDNAHVKEVLFLLFYFVFHVLITLLYAVVRSGHKMLDLTHEMAGE